MFPAVLDFTPENGLLIKRNGVFQCSFDIVENEDTQAPLDLTGWGARMQVRRFKSSPTALISLANTDVTWQGLKIATPAAGTIVVQIAESTLADMPAPDTAGADLECVYDLVLTGTDTYDRVYCEGKFVVTYGVTV